MVITLHGPDGHRQEEEVNWALPHLFFVRIPEPLSAMRCGPNDIVPPRYRPSFVRVYEQVRDGGTRYEFRGTEYR